MTELEANSEQKSLRR